LLKKLKTFLKKNPKEAKVTSKEEKRSGGEKNSLMNLRPAEEAHAISRVKSHIESLFFSKKNYLTSSLCFACLKLSIRGAEPNGDRYLLPKKDCIIEKMF